MTTTTMANDKPEGADSGSEFKDELLRVIPHLRAFARGLCGRLDVADDLVQETLVKVWTARDRFTLGSNMRAWSFTILRNTYLNELRRNRFNMEYDEAVAERVLTTGPAQEGPIHLSDTHHFLLQLLPEYREALLLVGAGGLSRLMDGEGKLPRSKLSVSAAAAALMAGVTAPEPVELSATEPSR
jgi:RNA polymerase sigma factor (sigma-70 family)